MGYRAILLSYTDKALTSCFAIAVHLKTLGAFCYNVFERRRRQDLPSARNTFRPFNKSVVASDINVNEQQRQHRISIGWFLICPFIDLSIPDPYHPSIQPSIHPTNHPAIHPSIHPVFQLSINQSIKFV